MPSAIPCSLSPLISRIHSSLFLDSRHTVSSKFMDMQVFSIFTKELVLPYHARCVLSRLCCNRHSLLLNSYLSGIGRIENPSCSACRHSSQDTAHLILHCPALDPLHCLLFGNSLSLYDLWSRPWRVAGFWDSMVSCHALIFRMESGNQQQQHKFHRTSFLNPVNSVNALYILLRTVNSFYLHYINTIVLLRLFHYLNKFLHHFIQKNKGLVY